MAKAAKGKYCGLILILDLLLSEAVQGLFVFLKLSNGFLEIFLCLSNLLLSLFAFLFVSLFTRQGFFADLFGSLANGLKNFHFSLGPLFNLLLDELVFFPDFLLH